MKLPKFLTGGDFWDFLFCPDLYKGNSPSPGCGIVVAVAGILVSLSMMLSPDSLKFLNLLRV